MSDITLRQAFSNIAGAIRAKGVTGTMSPLEMPTKIGTIYASKYGVSGDSVLGNVDQQGQLQAPTTSFQFSSTAITSIPQNMLQYKFYQTGITQVNLPNLTSIGNYGLSYAFYGCSSLASVEMSAVTTVGAYALNNAFTNCTSLVGFAIPSATSLGNYGMNNAFNGCTSLEIVDLSSVASIGTSGLNYAFYKCTSLTSVNLSSLSSAGSTGLNYTFNGCTSLEVVDFSHASNVPDLASVSAFGNTNNTYKIVVPDSLYSTWIAATNWSDSSIVGHIVKASEYTPAS